eukprot:scaffold7613_cov88-Amphora_coffeaeformis.AAC.1
MTNPKFLRNPEFYPKKSVRHRKTKRHGHVVDTFFEQLQQRQQQHQRRHAGIVFHSCTTATY